MVSQRRPKYKPVDVVWLEQYVLTQINDPNAMAQTVKNAIDEVQYTVCNYINRDYVPEPLKYVLANLVMDMYNAKKPVAIDSPLDNIDVGSIASIKDGDTDIKFSSKNTLTTRHTADVESLLFNYKIQLDKYRLIKW